MNATALRKQTRRFASALPAERVKMFDEVVDQRAVRALRRPTVSSKATRRTGR